MIYCFDEFELDTELFELRRRGAVCHIEPQVFNLLRYLIEHDDHVVSKDELLDQLWPGRIVTESALTSRLKTARKLIGDSGSEQRLIKTIHGRGYRFVGRAESREPGRSHVPTGADTPEVTSAGHLDGIPAHAEPTREADARLVTARRAETVATLPGRGAELHALMQCWRQAGSGELQLVFIEGEAGVGKTTLIEAFLTSVREEPALIGSGQCADFGGAGEAYLPMLDAIGGLLAGPAGAERSEALAAVAPSWLLQLTTPLTADTRSRLEQRVIGITQERMLREFAAAAAALSREQPLLLVLEDLHWADPSTLTLLEWIGRRREAQRVMILGSLRPPASTGTAPSLSDVVYGLNLRGLASTITLKPLDRDAIAAYLASRFREAAVAPGLAAELHARTDGHPLFLASLIDSWLERGLLETTGHELALVNTPAGQKAIPENLRLLIDEEIDRTEAEARILLDAASVVGTRFAATLIEAMLETECEEHLIALADAGSLLVREGDLTWPDGTTTSQFRFRHTLFRDAIYAALPARQRARLHGLAASRLELSFGARAADRAAELAVHFTAAGDAGKALRYRLEAAHQAYGRGGYREVIAHAEDGLTLLRDHPELPGRDEHELGFELTIAPALIQINGWSDPRAEAALTRAIELAKDLRDRRLPSALYLLAAVHELRGEYAKSQHVLEHQQALPEAFETELAELESHELLACSLYHQGAFAAALEHARSGLAAGCDYDLDSKLYAYGENPRVSCHNWAGLSLWFLGFPDQARASIEAGLALARKPNRRFSLSNALCQAAILAQVSGNPEQTLAYAEEALASAVEEGFRYPLAVGRILKGWALAVTGQTDSGLALMRQGLEGHRQSGAAMDRPYFLGLLAAGLVAAGERDEAAAVLDEALRNIDSARRFFYEPELARLAAQVALSGPDSDRKRARALLHRSLAAATASGNRMGQLRAEIDLLRVAAGPAEQTAATRALRATRESFTEGQDCRDLREASSLLA